MKKRLLLALALVVLVGGTINNTDISAKSKNVINNLEQDKNYTYDLDKDGKKDTLKYSWNEEKAVISISINGKVAKKINLDKEYGFYNVNLQVADIDKKDKTLDLFVYGFAFSEDVCYSALFEMKDGKLKKIFQPKGKQLNEGIWLREGYLFDTDGKGNFSINMDRAINCDYLTGNHWDAIPYKLKDGKVSRVKTEYYNFASVSALNSKAYKAKGKLIFSKKPQGKATSFTLKKGQKVTAVKMYVSKKGEVSVQFKNKDGKKGWLNGKNFSYEKLPFSNMLFAD